MWTISESVTTTVGCGLCSIGQPFPPMKAASPERQFLIALYSRKTISHPPASAIHAFEILDGMARANVVENPAASMTRSRQRPTSSSRASAGSCSTSPRWSVLEPRPAETATACCCDF